MIDLETILTKKPIQVNSGSDSNSVVIYNGDNNPIKISRFGKHLLDLIDGKRTLRDILELLKENDMSLEIDRFEDFIRKLSENDLFENYYSPKNTKKTFWQRISFFEIVNFYDDKFFEKVSSIYKGKLLLMLMSVSMLTIVCSLILLIFGQIDFSFLLVSQYSLTSAFIYIAAFMALSFVRVLFHESAHALACRYFGKKIRKIGFGLYLLSPVFYVDTTNMWQVQNKYKRIIVSAVGPLMDITFSSLLYIIAYFVSAPSQKHFLLVVAIIFTVKGLLNLNPFIKLDGYYIFVDLVGMPNLRKNSLQFIKDMIFQKGDINVLPPRTKLFFVVFGVLSSIMTLVFIANLVLYLVRAFL
jgi:putative peptide zinc metalloprotease protein